MKKIDVTKPGYVTRYLESKKRTKPSDAGCSLYYMRELELEPSMAVQLLPFIRAYAPHDVPPSRTYLESLGCEKVEEYTFTDELEDHYVELRGCTPEEWIETHPE